MLIKKPSCIFESLYRNCLHCDEKMSEPGMMYCRLQKYSISCVSSAIIIITDNYCFNIIYLNSPFFFPVLLFSFHGENFFIEATQKKNNNTKLKKKKQIDNKIIKDDIHDRNDS